MKYSKATNYALHTLIYMARQEKNAVIGVQELASEQKLSTSYLSKILTKLAKEGMVTSNSGVNGGYSLSNQAAEITFFDVIQAIEGKASLFECEPMHGPNCLVYQTMLTAEKKMDEELKKKKIVTIAKKMS